jgi:protein SCO1/2
MAFMLIGCSGNGEQADKSSQMDASENNHTAHSNMQMDAAEPSEESIYNVSSTWRNRHGEELQLNKLRGKVQVVAMVYTHCEHACPRILADMQRVKDNLKGNFADQTQFTIISIDPERDTPDRLKTFANENDLSKEKWTLLNGGNGDVLEIAALLGVKYKRVSDTDFTHSNMITVLNKKGEVIHQRKKLEDSQSGIIQAIEKAASS